MGQVHGSSKTPDAVPRAPWEAEWQSPMAASEGQYGWQATLEEGPRLRDQARGS